MLVGALPQNGESIEASALDRSDGGKAANQSVAAARLGADVQFVGAIGSDDIGIGAKRLLLDEAVGLDAVQSGDGKTGESVILSAASGEQVVVTWPGIADSFEAAPFVEHLRSSPMPRFVSIQGELPSRTNADIIAGCAGLASIVCNPSPVAPFLEESWDWNGVDVIVANELEASAITGAAAEQSGLARAVGGVTGVSTVVVTLGAGGVSGWSEADGEFAVRAPEVDLVDSTGAGDAFTGALLAGLVGGLAMLDACRQAVLAASYSVTSLYCIPSYPTRIELDEWSLLRRSIATR